jgi:hypothetical protein
MKSLADLIPFLHQNQKTLDKKKMLTLLVFACMISLASMNHESNCVCSNGACLYDVWPYIGQTCTYAFVKQSKYSDRTCFPSTCSTDNDVIIKLYLLINFNG